MTSSLHICEECGHDSEKEFVPYKTKRVGKPTKIFIPTKPQPASRVRVSRYGSYHLKSYADFLRECSFFLKTLKKLNPPKEGMFEVELDIICKKPKKPVNEYPRGDIDNYVKGYLDAITKAGLFWEDDIQVIKLVATKRYQETGEDYGAKLRVTELTGV